MSAEHIAVRLREVLKWYGVRLPMSEWTVINEAADALEAAEAENARLRAELAGITMHTVAQLEEELTAAEAKLAKIDALPKSAPLGMSAARSLTYADGWMDAIVAIARILHPDNEGDET